MIKLCVWFRCLACEIVLTSGQNSDKHHTFHIFFRYDWRLCVVFVMLRLNSFTLVVVFLSFLERENVRVRKRSCWKVFMFLVLLQANRLRQIDVHIYRTHSLSYVCSRALFSVTTVKLDLNLCSDLNLNSRESIIQSRILCRTIHICTIWMKNPILFGMRAERTS